MKQVLMQVTIDVVAFLALSGDDIVDEDAAIEQLEHIAAVLKGLSDEERDEFVTFVSSAARTAKESGDLERATLFEGIPHQLGIVA